MNREKATKKLGILYETRSCLHEGGIYLHFSFGRVIDSLAKDYDKVYLSGPIRKTPPDESLDYIIQSTNIELIAQPYYDSSLSALQHLWGIVKAYWCMCRCCKIIFIRGMVPYVSLFYLIALVSECKPCHWIVGNPFKLVRTHRRSGYFKEILALAYAWQDQMFTRLGRRITGGSFLCNGRELAEVYRSPQTHTVVSSTITSEEFFERLDTCQGAVVRILFIGFIRPEKGLEYLIEAMTKLKIEKPWELMLIGSWEKYHEYKSKLDALIKGFDIQDRISWGGYIKYGPLLFNYFKISDIFVCPSLSEGTPRVLIEARANSIPIIATAVGGIPTSITVGRDGILVPPKDVDAISKAIQDVINLPQLRQNLIRNGFYSSQQMTLDAFIAKVKSILI